MGRSRKLILFVHGFIGSDETWNRTDGKRSIKAYLQTEFDIVNEFDIDVFNYKTSISDKFRRHLYWIGRLFGKERSYEVNLSIERIALLLKAEIDTKYSSYDKIVIIAHSMGGLVTKSFFCNEMENDRSCSKYSFISLAVPHKGSKLALLTKPIIKSNPQLKELLPYSEFVTNLEAKWIRHRDKLPETHCFICEHDQIVFKESQEIEGISDDFRFSCNYDHSGVLTPKVKDDAVILRIIQICVGKRDTKKKIDIKRKTELKLSPKKDGFSDFFNSSLKSVLESIDGKPFFSRTINKLDTEFNYVSFLREVRKGNPIVLSAPGGVGKSFLLKTVSRELIKDRNSRLIYFQGKNWNKRFNSHISPSADTKVKVNNILAAFNVKIGLNDIEKLGFFSNSYKDFYLVLDGLNEILDIEVQKDLVYALYDISINYHVKVLIGTRSLLVDVFENWKHFSLNKLSVQSINKFLEKEGRSDLAVKSDSDEFSLLKIPFFLDNFVSNHIGKLKSSSFSDYIENHLFNLVPAESKEALFERIANILFENYTNNQRLFIEGKYFNENEIELFLKYGILKISEMDDSMYSLDHELVTEFFVAKAFSKRVELWNYSYFDRLSRNFQISFELLQMTYEQINNPHEAELFLKGIYDWNFNATLHCVENVNIQNNVAFSRAFTMTLYEKMFDRFYHTKKRLAKKVDLLVSRYKLRGVNREVFDTSSTNKLIFNSKDEFYFFAEENKSFFINDRYAEWYEIFSERNISENLVLASRISDKDPLIGWTVSNIFKRDFLPDNTSFYFLDKFSNTNDDIVKWRIIHTLGSSNNDQVLDFLFKCIGDRNLYIWIRFGAIRSLMEMLIYSASVKTVEHYIGRLLEYFDTGLCNSLIIEEFKFCLCNRHPEEKVDLFDVFPRITAMKSLIESDKDNKIWIQAKKEFYELNR